MNEAGEINDSCAVTSAGEDARTMWPDDLLIARTMAELNITSNAQLEALAGLARNTVSKARCDAQPLSAVARAKLFHLLGESWARDALLTLFGEKGRSWLDAKPNQVRN